MSAGRYGVGVLLTLLAVVPLVVGVRAARRALLPGWSGPPAWLVDVVAAACLFLVAGQLAGVAGVFGALPVALLTALTGAACFVAAPRLVRFGDPEDVPVAEPSVLGPAGRWFAIAVAALVSGPWVARTVVPARFGMGTIDSLWYHLPAAARFTQDGWIYGLQNFDGGRTTIFYPQDSALFHGFGFSAFDSDFASPFMNLGWLAVALLAGWCIGRPRGVAPVTMAGVAVLLATPVFVGTQPGGAYNDVIALAFGLAAPAFLLSTPAGRRLPGRPLLVLSAGCVGAVLGMKWSGLVAVGALTLVVVVLATRGDRIRTTLWWLAGMAATGGSWYVRNLVAVHNPLPPLGGSIGPIEIPTVKGEESDSIAKFLFDGRAWREDFLPGFGLSFGVVWPLFLACVAAGIVLGLVRGRDLRVRLLWAAAVLVLAGYVLGPQILTLFGRPKYFHFNLRYPQVAIALGLAFLPYVLRRRALIAAVAVAYGGLLVALQTDPTSWPTGLREKSFSPEIEGYAVAPAVLAVLVVAAVGWVLIDADRRRNAAVRYAAIGALVVLLVAGYGAERYALDHRYGPRTRYEVAGAPRKLYRWAQTIEDQRVAVIGNFFQYPFTGLDQSNHVQYLTEHDDRDLPVPITRCEVWRRAVNDGRYTYVVAAGNPLQKQLPPEVGWTAPGPATEVALKDGTSVVFRVDGRLDPGDCP